jgi:hypothetical protein
MRLNKWKHSLEKDNMCELCGLQVESEFHALVMCDHARNLQSAMRKCRALPSEELLSYTGPDWLLLLLSHIPKQMAELRAIMLWRTWFLRNEVVHGAKLIAVSVSVNFLLNYADSLQLSQCVIVKEDMKCKKPILSEYE